MLANIYLHWFDYVFERAKEMARRGGAVLVRYTDGFVVLAHELITGAVQAFIEYLCNRFGLRLL